VVTATLDNTTGFVWRGEQVELADTSVINPDLNLPWLNPVTGVVESGNTNGPVITWARSSPLYTYTGGPYYRGVQVTIEKYNGSTWVLQKWDSATAISNSTSDSDTTEVYYYNQASAPKLKLPALSGTYRVVVRATNGQLNSIAGTTSTTATAPSLIPPDRIYHHTSGSSSAPSSEMDDLHFSEIFEFYITK
jgi:hypothetical protein